MQYLKSFRTDAIFSSTFFFFPGGEKLLHKDLIIIMNGRALSPDHSGPTNLQSQPLPGTQQQLPQALQNLQRILQSQLANVNPIQLQQALQRQQVRKLLLLMSYFLMTMVMMIASFCTSFQHQQMVDAGRKQLEQLLQQLNVSCSSCYYFYIQKKMRVKIGGIIFQEQLLINISQQTHLSANPNAGNVKQLANLQQQQQQIMAQMQLTQQALTLGQDSSPASSLGSLLKEGILRPAAKQRERHLSETVASVGSDGSLKENHKPPDNNNEFKIEARNRLMVSPGGGGGVGAADPKTSSPVSPPRGGSSSSSNLYPSSPGLQSSSFASLATIGKLYNHGHCNWPGCDASVGSPTASGLDEEYFRDFQRHLMASHPLDDKSTAQTRVQLQIVNQLEMQLTKEKDRLDAMMKHLQLEVTKSGDLRPIKSIKTPSPSTPPSHLHLLQSSVERGSLVSDH